ncbi:hypothetical protein ACB092_06G086000 [Castanea dentata]
MSFGIEIAMAVMGLWALYLRPMVMRFAGEMAEVMGYAIYHLLRGPPFHCHCLLFLISMLMRELMTKIIGLLFL